MQQLFTVSVKSARRFLDRWNAWVQVGDLAPMKKLAKTITAKSEGILRSIATGLSNGVLEAINGNVQAAKRNHGRDGDRSGLPAGAHRSVVRFVRRLLRPKPEAEAAKQIFCYQLKESYGTVSPFQL